jgi:hypothetical protein
MTPLSIRVALVAGIAAMAMTVPAAASPTVWGETQARPAQGAVVQYAQTDIIGLGYESKKSKTSQKKPKSHTTGQAKDTTGQAKDMTGQAKKSGTTGQ